MHEAGRQHVHAIHRRLIHAVNVVLTLCLCHCTFAAPHHATDSLPPPDFKAINVTSNVNQVRNHGTKTEATSRSSLQHVPFLPAPESPINSILFMLNSYSFDPAASRVIATLENAVSWCNDHGQDVHIALYTSSPALADYVLAPDNRFFCKRTGRLMPISVLRYDVNITIHIAGMHRYLVSHVADAYGWFMYSEDDIAITWQHVDYLRRWTPPLQTVSMLPHLMRYEVMPLPASEPRSALVLDESPLPLEISSRRLPLAPRPGKRYGIAAHEADLIHLPNPYMALWHLPRHMVQRFVATDAWHGDVHNCPSTDPRVYFATFWLRAHANFTVPLADVATALVQHISTHYVGEAAGAVAPLPRPHSNYPLLLHHHYNTDAFDLVADLTACVRSTSLRSSPSIAQGAPVTHTRLQTLHKPLDGECRQCLASGKRASVVCAARDASRVLEYKVQCV